MYHTLSSHNYESIDFDAWIHEPVEPAEVAEPEPGVEFFFEYEENQGKQLSMILCDCSI